MSEGERIQRVLMKLLPSLSIPVRLYGAEGKALLPDDGAAIDFPSGLEIGTVNHFGTDYVVCVERDCPLILAVADNCHGAKDILCLLNASVHCAPASAPAESNSSLFFRKVLKREVSGMELADLAESTGVPISQKRCVLLFQLLPTESVSVASMLGDLLPLLPTDYLIELNRKTLALIKDTSSGDGMDEIIQFALAVQETVLEETGLSPVIGIGEEKESLYFLADSFSEARKALEIGAAFHADQHIHVYRNLLLERLLICFPADDSEQVCRQLFNTETEKLFTPEMITTIDTFFHKDLNLSDTARQLYIHRNTLVYRLDKIWKLTGLDIRRFDDAVTFKILYEMQIYRDRLRQSQQ